MKPNRFIEYDKVGDTGKTEIWNVLSRSTEFILGQIKWYPQWRQYCFFPSPNSVFNTGCLDHINGFIKELMSKRRI